MEQYIRKSALVAEIEKLKGKVDDGSSYCNGWQQALRMLELSFNTLETEEVVLEREVADYIEQHKRELSSGYFDIRRIARHFFAWIKSKGE